MRFIGPVAAMIVGFVAAPYFADAAPRPLTRDEKKVVGARLARVANYKKNLKIAEGDTLFVVRRVRVPRKRVKGDALDYEGVVTAVTDKDGARPPKGLTIEPRIDEVSFKRARRDRVDITLRYAVTVQPGAGKGGTIKFKLNLIQRAGLGESVFSVALQHKVKVTPPKPTGVDLTADFHGYRIYVALCRKRMEKLSSEGVRGLNLRQGGDLPALGSLGAATVKQVYEFDKWRRRAWIAYRHLAVGARSPDRRISALAQRYLKLLNEPDEKLTSLPNIPLVPGAAPVVASADVEKLEPEAREPAPPPKRGNPDGPEVLQPLGPRKVEKQQPKPEPRTEPKAPVQPTKKTGKEVTTPAPDKAVETGVGETVRLGEDGVSRTVVIPSQPRFLVLDDPNIAFGGAVRVSYAKISAQETATAPAAFFSIQAAGTSDLGLGLTIPVALVDLNVERAQTVTTVGNPLIEAKYRLHLPAFFEKRPSVMVRARWALPLSALSTVPPTEIGAEDFSFPAHFADTYAFLLEKHAFGAGVSTSWEIGMIHAGAQLNLDYHLAVQGSEQSLSFPVFGYGLSVGVRPFGDIVGAYVEARGAQLLIGPRRHELFTYLGLRGRFFDLLEPAAWVSLPLGSVGNVSSIQFGGELRIAYDVDSIVRKGAGRRADEFEF